MIDLNFVCSEQYDDYCKQLADNHCSSAHWYVDNFSINVPNIQDAKETNFFTPISGYTKPENSSKDDALLDVFYYHSTDFNNHIKKLLNLNFCDVALQIQQPGKTICPHVDRSRTFLTKILDDSAREKYNYTDVRRFLYFLEDQQLGQFFQIGDEYLRWKSGDLFEFSFYIPHATANASTSPRPILAITGI